MDPLAEQLACDCVAGYAQRKYDRLGVFLEKRLGRPVEISYTEALPSPRVETPEQIDLIIGKFSVVMYDAKKAAINARTVAMLTDQNGTVTLTGLFVVRQDDPAKSIEDLEGYRILFGPEDSIEKRERAFAALEAFGLPIPKDPATSPSCNTAAIAVTEKEADAAVISSYAMPLLEGCGTIDKGALRIVGRTDPVPFICVFATDRVDPDTEKRLLQGLLDVRDHPDLLAAMESKDGFLALPDIKRSVRWPDWRGRGRDGISGSVPQTLSAGKRLLWAHTMTGPGVAGLAVDSGCVVVADKGLNDEQDIFRCLDADTGEEKWKITYPAKGEMDFTNSPCANPVMYEGLVYLLGAFGDLHCAKLETGEVLWKKNLIEDFGADLPTWGFSSTPLIVGDKLIVNPGAKDASLVALDRLTGEMRWSTPGYPPAYASFILADFGGVRQIVGYDAISLGGWDPDTGKRLWELIPETEGDFNVPTPIIVGDKLLVSTENNGTRIYAFDEKGKIKPEPVALGEDLAPDTSTPVVLDGMVFGSCNRLVCLDLADLSTLWECAEDPFCDYCSFIAGNGRVLVMTQTGSICLLKADDRQFNCVSRLDLFDDVPDTERDVWSHPALVGNRLYVRNLLGVYCFLIE